MEYSEIAENEIQEEISEEEGVSLEQEEGESLYGIALDRAHHLMGAMEAILFMSESPVPLSRLKKLIDPDVSMKVYKKIANHLINKYESPENGVAIEEVAEGIQFRTRVGFSKYISEIHKIVPVKLSKTALEVLSIIAYKQPISKTDLDNVRGVDNYHSIKILLDRKMIKVTGRSEAPGRPALYGTTTDFLQLFGLNTLSDLPSLSEVEALVPKSQTADSEMLEQIVLEESNLDLNEDFDLEDLREKISKIPTGTSFTEALLKEDRKGKKQGLEDSRPKSAFDLVEDFLDEMPPQHLTSAGENETSASLNQDS